VDRSGKFRFAWFLLRVIYRMTSAPRTSAPHCSIELPLTSYSPRASDQRCDPRGP
jgi:hypothetical protein